MSAEIAVSALSMPQSLGPLKEATTLIMHRIIFAVPNIETWYKIMNEARQQFGKDWRCQPRVRRKFTSWRPRNADPVKIWFDVPDSSFSTWCAVKLGVVVVENTNK